MLRRWSKFFVCAFSTFKHIVFVLIFFFLESCLISTTLWCVTVKLHVRSVCVNGLFSSSSLSAAAYTYISSSFEFGWCAHTSIMHDSTIIAAVGDGSDTATTRQCMCMQFLPYLRVCVCVFLCLRDNDNNTQAPAVWCWTILTIAIYFARPTSAVHFPFSMRSLTYCMFERVQSLSYTRNVFLLAHE